MKKFTIVLALALMFVGTQTVLAQKFGHINTVDLLSKHPGIKAADSDLEALQKQYSNTISTKVESLKAEYADLASKEQDIAPKALQAQIQVLQEKEVALQKEEKELQAKLLKKREELYQPILDTINTEIKNLAEADGYTFIFDSSQGSLLYADDSLDLTSKVIEQLGL